MLRWYSESDTEWITYAVRVTDVNAHSNPDFDTNGNANGYSDAGSE